MLRKICIFVVALLCFSMSSHSVVLNHVVVFGDSLSDTGNLYTYTHHTTPSSPTYHQGRFSNGPIWIDAFMDGYAADHVLNYAFGGAGVLTEIWNLGVFTLHQEVDTYLLTHSDIADESSLFFIWIGANNYLVRGEQPNAQAIIDGILSNIERLIQHGATNFVVINLPD